MSGGHVRWFVEEVPVGAAGAGGAGDAVGSHPNLSLSHQFGTVHGRVVVTVNRSAISSQGVTAGARCATSGMPRGRRLTLK
jgi:hypothetical protein